MVHDVDHQSVYHVQFLPSPFLYVGDQKLAKGGQDPYDSRGLLRHLTKDTSLVEVNL